jgi:hypothetical protein
MSHKEATPANGTKFSASATVFVSAASRAPVNDDLLEEVALIWIKRPCCHVRYPDLVV